MTFIATKLFHKAGEGSGGGGGGDQHNLGWYATESALTTAHATASDGDWAIVGATDTVWVWDSDTSAWKDTDTKGQVTSVNGQTGAVTVDTLPSQTGNAGKFLTTNGTDASWNNYIQYIAAKTYYVGTTASGNGPRFSWNSIYQHLQYADNIASRFSASQIRAEYFYNGSVLFQMPSTPTGGSGIVGKLLWADYTGATQGQVLSLDANLTPVWTTPSGGLPSQTGQSGKFLTTDGTDASWSDKPLINQLAGGTLPTGSVGIKTYVYNNNCVAINSDTVLGANGVTLIGKNTFANDSNHYAVGIGYGARTNAPNAILINASGTSQYNDTANTFKIGNTNGVFEMMSADGTIPEARLADTTNAQQGDVLTLDSTGNAVWQAGGSGLPDQTGQSGKFLTTDGTDASWSDKPLVNKAAGTSGALNIGGEYSSGFYATARNATNVGTYSRANIEYGTAYGFAADVRGYNGIALGADAYVHNNMAGGIAVGAHAQVDAPQAIQISAVTGDQDYLTNNESKTVRIGFGLNENYKVLDSDGTIPAARHAALPAADGTYTLQLVIADGVPTLSWVAV
jgi:hypothetical protein